MEDLAFESIDVVQLVVALEKNFERKGLPFEQLFMREGDYVDELEVKEIVEFLHKNLQ
jgi:acyl carrier protein